MTSEVSVSPLQYDKIIESHRRALSKLELELEFFLRDVGNIDVFSLSSRIKDYGSALRKSEQLSLSIDMLDDLAGIRIVVGAAPEIPIIERFFSRQEYGKDIEIKKRQKIKNKNGYRALHLVVEFKGHYQTSMYPGRVEVQLQTIFEHAFNFLSRNWSYKQPWRTSYQWEKDFAKVSKSLAEIEQAVSALHTDLVESASSTEAAPLTPHSLRQIVLCEFGEEIDILNAVDSCRMYSDIGYKTNGQIKNFFRDPNIVELYESLWQNKNNNEPITHIAKLGKNGFWQLFGTKIHSPGLREFLLHITHPENS